ncbi:MAG: hypothetical protein IPP91_11135 [Betaproteobacteria bacterium]|nr:hypothetical protein [Betaproteobacteria bacterium]
MDLREESEAVSGGEQSGRLSRPERDFLPEAIARIDSERGQTTHEEGAWRRKVAARKVLARELDDISFEDLLEDLHRGAVAAQLYATWAGHARAEPFTETPYMVTGIYADLTAAMNAHGLPTFEERCAEIGKRLVEHAIDYVLTCHTMDAEAVLEDRR